MTKEASYGKRVHCTSEFWLVLLAVCNLGSTAVVLFLKSYVAARELEGSILYLIMLASLEFMPLFTEPWKSSN